MANIWILKVIIVLFFGLLLDIRRLDAVNFFTTVAKRELRDLMHRCPDGSFGYKCKYMCHCLHDEPCDRFTGTCYNTCAEGYWGPGCQLSNNCFYNGQARHYQGLVTVTQNFHRCQRWDSQTPHRHSYNDKDFPDENIPENFCRTTKDSSRPWCYTQDKRRRWEHCNVNNCNCPLGRFGHNCDKECHCRDGGEPCDSIMGLCKSGCASGWSGFDCQTPERCPVNKYGWDCSQDCYCVNSDHCDRFTGPTPQCKCAKGYFNDPYCEPVTAPRVMHFDNIKVTEGQPAVFNCTVSAFPQPREDEIRLVAPLGKRVTLIQTTLVDMYTRSNVFQVNTVDKDERYKCIVNAISGDVSFTKPVDVFVRPHLVNPPRVVKESTTSTQIQLEWPPWNPAHGDLGDPPITWYSVWVRPLTEASFKMGSVVPEWQCHQQSKCNYTVTGLSPNTPYVLYIAARRKGDTMDGPPGPLVHVKTGCSEPVESPIITRVTGEMQSNTSHPKARMTVHWKDAPKETWNCDSIRKYQIQVSSGEPDVLVTHIAGRAYKQFQISELEPGVKYCITIRYENSDGLYSPTSNEKCVVSPSKVPSAPTNLQMTDRTDTSLTFSWERPGDVRANMTIYTIIYWKGYVRELSTKKGVEWQSADPTVEYTLTGLDPDTTYHVQVQTVNSAGSGDYSSILTMSTTEGRPGPVSRFRNISRTQNSIMLQWKAPQKPNGDLLSYHLSCMKARVKLSSLPEPFRIAATVISFNYTGLLPSTEYQCSINASSSLGTSVTSTLIAWTTATDPEEPPPPMILGRSDSTVTLEIKPHTDQSVSFYRIIVERLYDTRRRRRSVPETVADTRSDFYTAQRDGAAVYIAAQLDSGSAGGKFVVGDNKTYGGYHNAPLNSNYKYNIWFGAYTETDEGIKSSISQAVHGPLSNNDAIKAVPPTNHVPVIIGVLIVFIVLILVVTLLLFIWRKKHIQSEREKAEMPNFGPTIIPEPDLTPPSTPIESFESDPLLEASVASEADSEPVYGNIGFEVAPVKVEDLWDYVKNNKCNDCEGLRREYKLIPAGITACCEAAKKQENKNKNRYGNIVAYDHTRVVLHDYENDEHDDYINANYIDGYNKPKAYVAAQGPTKSTLKDIWRMVWQEQSKTIIMLTNPTETGKKKCEFYWPDDDVHTFHGITVECLGTSDLPDFTTRTFKLTKNTESRIVLQFHYTTWPDHGVPKFSSSLLLLRQKIRAHDNLECGPQIIHCSAGVGRTGTYIAIDVELERAKTEGMVDVHNFVQLMRTQRINMVQTLDQYVFVYDCLLEALISGDTLMRADEYPEMLSEMCQYDNVIQKTKLEEQYDILRLITTTIERDESTSALRAENMFKNRCKTIIPANRCRPFLMTPWEGCNDYINAVFSNSYTRRDGFILTQMPLPNTVIDFWRLVHDHNVAAIVMLNELEPGDEMCEQYWSLASCGEQYGPFIVETTAEINSDPSITTREFTVSNTEMPHAVPRVVRQFHFHRWNDESSVPSSKLALFELLDMVDTCQRHSGNRPVIVHCMDGATRSGLYVALSILIERLRLEKEVDVFQTVKQLRLCRTQLIDDLEQFRYCHEIVLDFINNSNMNTMSTFAPVLPTSDLPPDDVIVEDICSQAV